jgi:hypothetical protein
VFRFLPYERYLMPGHFGPLHQDENSSGWYRDVTMMIVPYVTDREKLAAFFPEPFTVGEVPTVTVTYACSKDVDWLAGRGYNLIAVTASAVFNGKNEQLVGQYSLVWWENLTDAIISGRELTGIPKIFADIADHSITDGRWQTSASHFDNKILDMSVRNLRPPTAEEIESAQAAREGKDHPMAWRYLPGVGGFGATVSEPTTFPSESIYTGLWIGEGSLDWNRLTFEQNPTQYHVVNALADLPVLEYLPAMVTTGSTNLFVPDRLPRVLDKKETLPVDGESAPERRHDGMRQRVDCGNFGLWRPLVRYRRGESQGCATEVEGDFCFPRRCRILLARSSQDGFWPNFDKFRPEKGNRQCGPCQRIRF